MAGSKSRVSEEKMLNDMFVLLEYSDNFKEFVAGLSEAAFHKLHEEIHDYQERHFNGQ